MTERLPLFEEPISESPSKKKSAKPRKPSPLNDIDLDNWREYGKIETNSLWIIPERDRSGTHMADYHGNFVPQIPRQAMWRYTKKGDVLLDAFLGSGTSLIECRTQGRHGIGIELKPELAQQAKERIEGQDNPHGIITQVLTGDSSNLEAAQPLIKSALEKIEKKSVQLAILHPPYHSIIKFSDRKEDLSNCPSVEEFRQRFVRVVDVVDRFLEKERYLVLVIGDMYENSEWIPLGFKCMQEVSFVRSALPESLKTRVKEVYKNVEAITQRTYQPAELEVDHRFAQVRWSKPEDENPPDMSDSEIIDKFQLLTRQHNLWKSRYCERCKETGVRGTFIGINYFYEGGPTWPEGIADDDERGCHGCFWYNPDKWRQSLNALIDRQR